MSTKTAPAHPPSPMPYLRSLYAVIETQLQEVERILQAELRSEHPYVDELVRYGCLLGGKRLRPALLLLSAHAAGGIRPPHLTLAAVVEMIHTATLIHDDVLDGAVTRRHLATVNSRWDNEASVLLGDFLFSHALWLASRLDSTAACRILGASMNVVCEGELRQKGTRGDFGLSEAEYLSIIEAKTAELCACSCRLGAHFADADSAVIEQLDAYGRNLGIAFQIADDLLDVVGDESATGKSLGTDLARQTPTLPVIRLLTVVSRRERDEVLAILEGGVPGRLSALRPFLEHHDAIRYAREKADDYADRARRQLDSLAPSPAVEAMRLLTQFVVARPA